MSYQIRLKRTPPSRLPLPVGHVGRGKRTQIIRIWYEHNDQPAEDPPSEPSQAAELYHMLQCSKAIALGGALREPSGFLFPDYL